MPQRFRAEWHSVIALLQLRSHNSDWLRAGRLGFKSRQGQKSLSLQRSDQLWNPPCLLLNAYSHCHGKSSRNVKATQLHLALRLRMSGAIFLRPYTPSWFGQEQLHLDLSLQHILELLLPSVFLKMRSSLSTYNLT